MRKLKQWVNWKEETRNGKKTKPPYNPTTGRYASHNDPTTWGTYEQAKKAKDFDGIGFVFTEGDPFCGIDLDKCRNPETGEIKPWALKVVKTFNSYTETSPSGTGLHIIIRGTLSGGGIKTKYVEIYDRLRYFTVTGNRYGDYRKIREAQPELDGLAERLEKKAVENPTPATTPQNDYHDDNRLIDKMLSSVNGGAILRLLDGHHDGYPSQSEADQALCNHLAFWFDKDPQAIDRQFRRSGLMRDKWDKKHYSDGTTYGQATISKAVANTSETYHRTPQKHTGGKQPQRGMVDPRWGNVGIADLREYIDLCVVPGQKITVDEMCRGLSCYKREDRKVLYRNVNRLCKEGILKKDNYRHGGYRRVIEINEFDLSGAIEEEDVSFDIKLPLGLENFIQLKPDQLLQVSGRYDAGKSSFLFQLVADNYQEHKIVHILSDEWSLNAIKERMDILGIERPHENIKVLPMQPGYEDMIPSGRCIVLIDYIRADQNPFETDAQIQRILKNLNGGVAIFATQKHPGLDRPVGGQFAVHASHHIVLLDRWKGTFTCKMYRTKSERDLEGLFRTFKLDDHKRLTAGMADWKKGDIKWEKDLPQDGKDGKDGK